jgi:hypothetical protein
MWEYGDAVADGRLTGGDDAATQYFRRATGDALAVRPNQSWRASEERAIRKDPLGQASSLIKRVFSAAQ